MSEHWVEPFNLGPVCITPGCTCPTDYTGRSDWIDAKGYLCHVNIWAVRALWIAHLVEWAIVVVFGLPKFAQLYRRIIVKRKRLSAIPTVVWTVLIFFLVVMPSCCSVALVRIFDENARIALDLSVTIPWVIARMGIFIGNGVYQPSLLKTILAAENITVPFIRLYTWRERILAGLFTSNSLLFIPVYVTGGMDVVLARICFALFIASNALFMLGFLLSARSIDRRMQSVLTKSYNDTKSEAVLSLKGKLHATQLTIQRNSAVQVLLNSAWLLCPPLWVAHDYIFPILWISAPIVAHAALESSYIRVEENSTLVAYKRQTKEIVVADIEETRS